MAKYPCTMRTAELLRNFISEKINKPYGYVLAGQGNHKQLRKWAENCKNN